MIIGVSELQKNISIIKNLTETLEVVDKKTKEVLALILPKSQLKNTSLTDTLGGILHSNKSIESNKDLKSMIENAYSEEMKEKYGK